MAEPSGPESGPDRAPDTRSEQEAVNALNDPVSLMGGSWAAPEPSRWSGFLDFLGRYAPQVISALAPSLGPLPGAVGGVLGIANKARQGGPGYDPGWDILNFMGGGVPQKAVDFGRWAGNTVADLRGMTPEDRRAEAAQNRAREAQAEQQAATRGGGPSAESAGVEGIALTPRALQAPPGAPLDPLLAPKLPGEWLTPAKPLVPSRMLPMATDLPGEQALDLRGADPRFDPLARQALPPEALAYLKALSRILR